MFSNIGSHYLVSELQPMGPRRAGDPPQYSSTPPRPPDPGNLRMKLQVELAETAAGFRELHKCMASMATEQAIFQSEILNELRKFRLERTAQLRPPPPPPPPLETADPYHYQHQQAPTPLPPFPVLHPQHTTLQLQSFKSQPQQPVKQHHMDRFVTPPPLAQFTASPPPLLDDAVSAQPNNNLASFCSKGESVEERVEVHSGDGREFNELESVSAKQDDGGFVEDKEQVDFTTPLISKALNTGTENDEIVNAKVEVEVVESLCEHSDEKFKSATTDILMKFCCFHKRDQLCKLSNGISEFDALQLFGKSLQLEGLVSDRRIGDAKYRWLLESFIVPTVDKTSMDYFLEAFHSVPYSYQNWRAILIWFLAAMIQCSLNPTVFIHNILLGGIDGRVSLHFVSKMETKANIVEKMFDGNWKWKSQITFGTSVRVICVKEFNVDFFGFYMVLDKKCLEKTICNLHLCMSSLNLKLLQVPVHLNNRGFGFTHEWHLGNIIWNIAGNTQKLFVAMHGGENETRFSILHHWFPISSNDAQRQATKSSSRIEALVIDQENNFQRGDSYLDMVTGLFKNDFSLSSSRNKEGLILDLRLCCGTIDVSYLEIFNGVFEVTVVSFESFGGENSNHAGLNFIVSEFTIIKFTVSLLYLRPIWCLSKLVISGSVAFYHRYKEHKRFKCVNNIKISLLVGLFGSSDTQEAFQVLHTILTPFLIADYCHARSPNAFGATSKWELNSLGSGEQFLHVDDYVLAILIKERLCCTSWFNTYINTLPSEPHTGTNYGVMKVMGVKEAMLLGKVILWNGKYSKNDENDVMVQVLGAALYCQIQGYARWNYTVKTANQILWYYDLMAVNYMRDLTLVYDTKGQMEFEDYGMSFLPSDIMLGEDLFVDLQNGLRLFRAIQFLKDDCYILMTMVVPSDTNKKHMPSCGTALHFLEAGIVLHDDEKMIVEDDFADGDKELTISLIQNMFVHLQVHATKSFDEKWVGEIARKIIMVMINAWLYCVYITAYTTLIVGVCKTLQLSGYEIRNSDELFSGGLAKHFPQIKSTSTPFWFGSPSAISMVTTLHYVASVRWCTALGVMKTTEFISDIFYWQLLLDLVITRIGKVPYKLELPPTAKIHQVFHVSRLKKKVGSTVITSADLPPMFESDKTRWYPAKIIDRGIFKKNNAAVTKWLVRWKNTNEEDETWEDPEQFMNRFPEFQSGIASLIFKRGGMLGHPSKSCDRAWPKSITVGHILHSYLVCDLCQL